MPASIGYSLENEKAFLANIKHVFDATGDLTVPFSLIRADFYKDQKRIFLLQGPGGYQPLSEAYFKRKQRLYGFAYPIFKTSTRHGHRPKLEPSLTDMNDPNAVNIITKASLIMGTKVKYGIYHQSDKPRKKIPLRKFLFIDGSLVSKGPGIGYGRIQRWMSILNDHVAKQVKS